MAVLGAGAVAGWSVGLVSCNAVLGINAATAEDAGVADAGCATDYTVSCDNYCALVSRNCAGPYQEYNSPEVCQQVCRGSGFEATGPLPLTESAKPMGQTNTLGCRVWHANAACRGLPQEHCPHAGPLGGKTCWENNDPCIAFCLIDLQVCQGSAAAYANNDACLAACRGDAGAGSGYFYDTNGPEFSSANMGNDTLNCRMYHVQNALAATLRGDTMNSVLHCSHTALSGGTVCVARDN